MSECKPTTWCFVKQEYIYGCIHDHCVEVRKGRSTKYAYAYARGLTPEEAAAYIKESRKND